MPQEQTTQQMWHLLKLGEPNGTIESVNLLLRDSPCTTGLVEKAHGQGATFRRFHAHIVSDTLVAGALLAETRVLMRDSPAEKRGKMVQAIDEKM